MPSPFFDSNGDGIGDLNGLIQKLDYIDRHQPNTIGTERVDVIELLDQAVQVADAVAVRVEERADEHLVADGAAGPGWGGRLLPRERRQPRARQELGCAERCRPEAGDA